MEPPAPVQPARLVALEAEVGHKTYLLHDDVYLIGRFPTCQIIIARPLVSRYHARIERDGPRYLLSDMGSANGTFVNGRPLQGTHTLKDQDRIGLGSPQEVLCFFDPDPTLIPQKLLQFDKPRLRFLVHGQPLELTKLQFLLLQHLHEHASAVCSRESCALAIWKRPYNPDLDADALDRNVSGLRALLRKAVPGYDLIETVRGHGYVLKL